MADRDPRAWFNVNSFLLVLVIRIRGSIIGIIIIIINQADAA